MLDQCIRLNTVAALQNVFFSLPLSEGMIFYYAFDNFWLVFNQVKLNIPVKKYLRINEIETHWLLFCVRIHFITHSKSHIIWLPCRMLVITIDWHVHFSREIGAWLCRIKPNIPSNCLLLDLFVLNKIVNHFFSVEYLLSSLNLRQFSLYHFECSLVRFEYHLIEILCTHWQPLRLLSNTFFLCFNSKKCLLWRFTNAYLTIEMFRINLFFCFHFNISVELPNICLRFEFWSTQFFNTLKMNAWILHV